ncbi:MAG: hypothetical protein B1H07_03415 [Campylobacteraceae bacterium 4484_166]|nr:MAG: hypothetical protein B1H07_03415 [Campylobacteraceae bacterium 4484_166]
MGDFNQRIPRKYSPQNVYNLMIDTFSDFDIVTKNNIQPINKLSIDHLYTKNCKQPKTIQSIDNIQNNIKLSDHFGLDIII